jgi:ketosteroid isomerase-like protein
MWEVNVAVVRRFVEDVHKGEYGDAESCLHPDVTWQNTSAFPGRRTLVGSKAVIEFWHELFESFATENGGFEIEELIAGGEHVVMGVHSWGHGAGSGVPIDVHWALTVQLRDAKIARVDIRGDYASALSASGLRE